MPAVGTIEEFWRIPMPSAKFLPDQLKSTKELQVYDIEKVPFLEISINKIKEVNPGLAKED